MKKKALLVIFISRSRRLTTGRIQIASLSRKSPEAQLLVTGRLNAVYLINPPLLNHSKMICSQRKRRRISSSYPKMSGKIIIIIRVSVNPASCGNLLTSSMTLIIIIIIIIINSLSVMMIVVKKISGKTF